MHPGYSMSNRLHELYWKRLLNHDLPQWVRFMLSEYHAARKGGKYYH